MKVSVRRLYEAGTSRAMCQHDAQQGANPCEINTHIASTAATAAETPTATACERPHYGVAECPKCHRCIARDRSAGANGTLLLKCLARRQGRPTALASPTIGLVRAIADAIKASGKQLTVNTLVAKMTAMSGGGCVATTTTTSTTTTT